MATKSIAAPKSVNEYLAAFPPSQRAALEKLRKTIHAAAPDAEECISYQLAAFRQNGMLVSFGATAKHCAFYVMSSTLLDSYKDKLANFETSKGTIRFQPDRPLPAALVKELVKARIAENERLATGRKASRVSKRTAPKKVATDTAGSDEVDEFLRTLHHPLKPALELLRSIFRSASPSIHEGIKWKSPSFRTTDYFATINMHGQDQLRLILHTGAKVKVSATQGLKIADPAGLLKWLAKDRALIAFSDLKDINAKRAALKRVIREWISQV